MLTKRNPNLEETQTIFFSFNIHDGDIYSGGMWKVRYVSL